MPPAISPIATILGGQTVKVTLLDGTSLEVTVRQMPARHLITQYLALSENEGELLDVVCRCPAAAPKDWVDQLSDESHALLVATAHELNFSRATKQVNRQLEFRRRLQVLEVPTSSSPNSSTPPPSS